MVISGAQELQEFDAAVVAQTIGSAATPDNDEQQQVGAQELPRS